MCKRWIVVGAVLLSVAWTQGCSDDDPASVDSRRFSESSDSTFVVGDASVLTISDFAGAVEVTAGDPGALAVTAQKWAARETDLEDIELTMEEIDHGVEVEATNPLQRLNVSVDIQAVGPPDLSAAVQVGAGSILYVGPGEGNFSFTAGAGSVTVRLPPDANVEVHLTVAAGTIALGFPVVGEVGSRLVDGVIGTGLDGRISVQVAAGTITVAP